MSFPHAFLQQLRDTLPLSEVIGRRIRLTRKGKEWSACCPFHQEKTPSFTVNDAKQFYHCFGCQAHGDVITFMKEYEGLNFSEAVEQLAREAGLDVPRQYAVNQAEVKIRQDGYALMDAARQWFQAQLETAKAREACDYLLRRGLESNWIAEFGIGYAPDGRQLLQQAMKARGFTAQQLQTYGLISTYDSGEQVDKFRGRIIFPIQDRQGRTIAFGGRILGDGQPKYLNSPETPIFHKSNVLFAAHLARKPAQQAGRIIIVEGYMDVIALHRAGIGEAVAPLGTAVTEHQLRQLWSMADEPICCLDGDQAGQRAMQRAAELALPLLTPGKGLRFTSLPEGMDPDDLLAANGREALERVLSQATPLSQTLWNMQQQMILGAYEATTAPPEKLAELESSLMKLASQLSNPTLQNHLERYFRHQCQLLVQQAQQDNRNPRRPARPLRHVHHKVRQRAIAAHTNDVAHERAMIALLIAHPLLLEEAAIEEALANVEMHDTGCHALQSTLLSLLTDETDMTHEAVMTFITEKPQLSRHYQQLRQDATLRMWPLLNPTADRQEARQAFLRQLSHMALSQQRQEHAQQLQSVEGDMTEQQWQHFLTAIGHSDLEES